MSRPVRYIAGKELNETQNSPTMIIRSERMISRNTIASTKRMISRSTIDSTKRSFPPSLCLSLVYATKKRRVARLNFGLIEIIA